MGRIPISFRALADEYPSKTMYPTADLLGAIGGQVRSELIDQAERLNTCCIRLSWSFNRSGLPLHHVGGLHFLKAAPRVDPKTEGWVKPTTLHEIYLIRVKEFYECLTTKFGKPRLIYDGDKQPNRLAGEFTGPTQGVVAFRWSGDVSFGATGHVDLFRLILSQDRPPAWQPACVEECFFVGPHMKAFLWETNP